MNTFLRNKGGYRKLRVYRLSVIIYDLSVIFSERFIRAGSRTWDQMVQAARSGKQNIAEGSKAATTSRTTEIKLTNVAKASLEELMLDYEDYLRQNNLPQWDKSNPRTLKLREYLKSEEFLANPTKFAFAMNAEEFCNLCITLINQATYMLHRLIDKQQEQFLKEGGINEQMYSARVQYRKSAENHGYHVSSDRSDRSDQSDRSDKMKSTPQGSLTLAQDEDATPPQGSLTLTKDEDAAPRQGASVSEQHPSAQRAPSTQDQ